MNIAILYDDAAADDESAVDVRDVLAAVEGVGEALAELGHVCQRIGVDAHGDWIAALRAARVQLVFNLCEGVDGSSAAESTVRAAIDAPGIPCTGADALTLATARDKARTNTLLAAAGVPVPQWRLLEDGQVPGDWSLFPAIVKPAAEDASIGITQHAVATDRAALARAVRAAAGHGPLLVQSYVAGRELNVGIVGTDVLPVAEIDFSAMPQRAWHIVGYAAKWEAGSAEDLGTAPRCPADLDDVTRARVEQCARRAWRALGGTGYGRVDLRVAADNTPYVLEVNPNADLAPGAGLARMAAAHGWSYRTLVERVLAAASPPADDDGVVVAGTRRAFPQHMQLADAAAITLGAIGAEERAPIEAMLRATGFFRAEEIDVALEVFDAFVVSPGTDYSAVGAFTPGGNLVGYAMYGPTPCTQGTYDVYWIAVAPEAQNAGVGTILIEEVERRLSASAARLVIVETSSLALYAPTHAFYLRRGYREVARVPDFYAEGDDRLIFAKRLLQHTRTV